MRHALSYEETIASVTGCLFIRAAMTFFIAGAASDAARAAPNAEPIWRAVVLRADPIAKRVGGRNAFAALDKVDILQPTPKPVRNIHGR